MNTDMTIEPVRQEKAGTAEADLASRLLLVASIIVNVIGTDNFLVLASILNLTAGFLTIRAARQEAEEQQIAPGVTTFANGLKLIGSHTGLFVSILFFLALLIEINLKHVEPTVAEPTFAGALGSFMV
jgi:hypothetical protein